MKHPIQILACMLILLVQGMSSALGQSPSELLPLADVERELKGGETHSYRISLASGQFLHALVEQKDIDVITSVVGPDDKQLTESDSPNDRWGTEPILFVAATAGDYRVVVRSSNIRAPAGRYQIQIVALREATAIDKGHAAAQAAFDGARKLRVQTAPESKRASIEKSQQALPLFEAAGDRYRRTLTLLAIGIAYYQLSDFRTALDYFNQTVSSADAIGDRRLESGAQTFVGGMLDILGDVGKALVHYQRALKLAREENWRLTEGNALSNMGKIYSDLAEWQKALEFYAQALTVFKGLGSKANEAITLNNIGIAYSGSGEFQKALDYLQEALVLERASSDKKAEAYTLLNMGRVYRRLNDNKKALSYCEQAQAIQREISNRAQEAETLDEIGSVVSAEGQYEKALEYHRQAAEMLRAVGNLRREALVLTNLGEAYNMLGQPENALKEFGQALSVFRNIGDPSSTAMALEGIARAELKRGNIEEARKSISESLALIETVRSRAGSFQLRASYRATVEKAYEFYIDVLMQQHTKDPSKGYDAEALRASERARARSLLEQLTEAPIDVRQGVDASLIDKEADLRRVLNAKAQREMQLKARKGRTEEITVLKREISTLEDEYQQVQAAIRKTSPQYAALTQPQPLGLKDVQQQLDPDTVLLEYSLGDERSYLWVVAQDSLKTFALPNREEIQKLAQKMYDSLVARSVINSLETPAGRRTRIARADRQFRQTAAELSQMILMPAVDQLRSRRVVIVPDGALQYVPFAALPITTAASFRPLILDYEVTSLQSASAFAVQRKNLSQRESAPRSVAVIADPVFSPNDARLKAGAESSGAGATRILEHQSANASAQLSIQRLPYTRWEADQIMAVAPAASSMKAVDFRANRSLAAGDELSKYRYVHFATHGYLDTTRAGLSAIVLSLVDEKGKPQDGFLRTHDIYNLKLPAELVVLSACETGLGKDVEGEGLEGLTRAFMYAGARRVVVSLWNVNDKATAGLMQHFYTGMLRGKKTPSGALRAAQIEMLRNRQWQSPYFWAGFVMQGEWK